MPRRRAGRRLLQRLHLQKHRNTFRRRQTSFSVLENDKALVCSSGADGRRAAGKWAKSGDARTGQKKPANVQKDITKRTAASLFKLNFDGKCNLCPVSFVCVYVCVA